MATIKPITWAEGYFVSDDGLVLSSRRGSDLREKRAAGIHPYAKVCLMVNGKQTSPKYVHRLVAEAFIPNPNNLPYINHIDGNKRNNKANNLEWVSSLENFKHARDTGLFKCKLTDDDVSKIREFRREGATLYSIAKLFSIDQSMVSLIASGKRYGWLA